MNHIGLFEGIGGFSLAARWSGWETIAWCECNDFGQQVLKHHFPNAKPHGDITKTDFTIYRGKCDIITGGFPCQPFSVAGTRKGTDDERHLWPEMLRAIREIQPRWVVGENVRGLTNWNGGLVFDQVQTDLEIEGYEITPFLLPACAVNAPHRRDRIWFVAYAGHHTTRPAGNSGANAGCEFTTLHQARQSGDRTPIFDIGSRDLQQPFADTENQRPTQRAHEVEHGRNPTRYCTGKPSRNGSDVDTTTDEGRNGKPILGTDEPVGTIGEIHSGERPNVANTSGNGLEGWRNNGLCEQPEQSKPTGFGTAQSITNAASVRQPSEEHRQTEPGRITKTGVPNDWQNFPIESPLCDGNDGFSARLVGITFPKWRNESIKAGGNAIVPQVAFEIFKAINEYEKLEQDQRLD